MRILRYCTAALLLTLVWTAPVLAADVPQLLNYQGRLTAPDGTPKDGTFTMVFSVYDAEIGGNQLPTATPWSETQSVTVTDGVFNVLLGSVTALPATLFEGGPLDSAGPLRFLNVVVGGETLEPRRRIGSAAYAIHASPGSATSGIWEHVATAVFTSAMSNPVQMSVPQSGDLHMLVFEKMQAENNTLELRLRDTGGGYGTHRYFRVRASDNTIDVVSGSGIPLVPIGSTRALSGTVYFNRLPDVWLTNHPVVLELGGYVQDETFLPASNWENANPVGQVEFSATTGGHPVGTVHLYRLVSP